MESNKIKKSKQNNFLKILMNIYWKQKLLKAFINLFSKTIGCISFCLNNLAVTFDKRCSLCKKTRLDAIFFFWYSHFNI